MIAHVHNVLIWQRLDGRYGAPEHVSDSIKTRLERLPKVPVSKKRKIVRVVWLVSWNICDERNRYIQSNTGIFWLGNKMLTKLPGFIQAKWIDHDSNYKIQHSVMCLPFHIFVEFIHKLATRLNDPSFKMPQFDKNETVGRYICKMLDFNQSVMLERLI